MSILSDWNLRKRNATTVLLRIYHELREVFNSDLLDVEKEHLFEVAHRETILDRAWLVRPDLYLLDSDKLHGPCDLTRYDHEAGRSHTVDPCNRLRGYLDELAMMLDYAARKTELLLAVEEVDAVMAMNLPIGSVNNTPTCNERVEHAKKLVPRLRAAVDALGLTTDGIGAPDGGYFWYYSSQTAWAKAVHRIADLA